MIYEGEWHDDYKHGEGQLTYPDGKIIKTIWNKEYGMHGDGTIIYPSGKTSQVTFYRNL